MGLSLDQDPAVYTFGTEYLMPGPAGNLYKVPNDSTIRKVLVDQARKATAVFDSVNMPIPPPEMVVRALPPMPAAPQGHILTAHAQAEDMKAEQARKAIAAAAAPPTPVRAKAAPLAEDDDEVRTRLSHADHCASLLTRCAPARTTTRRMRALTQLCRAGRAASRRCR